MITKKQRILLTEDDQSFGRILRDYLSLNGFEVMHTKDGIDGWNTFRNHHFDLCILDIMMPKRDGMELAQMIRKDNQQVPLIFLTAKNRKDDMLNGFDSGADDYVVKPVDADILLLKIKALLKRSGFTIDNGKIVSEFNIASFNFNHVTRTLSNTQVEYLLSPKEADVLQMLCHQMNTLVRREDILRKLWKEVNYFNGRSLDVYIAKLRKYLAADSQVALNNLHKSGYLLKVVNSH